MRKIISILAAVVSSLILVPAGVFAATVSSQAVFENGQTKVYGNAGTSVPVNYQVHINAGEVLHAIRTKVDSQPTVCTAVGPFEGDQTVNVNVNVTLPPNSNTSGYNLVADLFTTDTLPQAQAMTGDLACSSAGSGAHVFTAAYNGSGVVNVLPSNGSTGTDANSSSIQSQINSLTLSLKSLTDAFTAFLTKSASTTPSAKPACPPLYTGFNASFVQDWLINNGYSGPFTAIGVTQATGFWGNASGSAYTQATNACK